VTPPKKKKKETKNEKRKTVANALLQVNPKFQYIYAKKNAGKHFSKT
jgi:hypothetical protein